MRALEQFFGCYLHQDISDEYPTLDAAVLDFAKASSLQSVEEVERQLIEVRDVWQPSEFIDWLESVNADHGPNEEEEVFEWVTNVITLIEQGKILR